MRITGPMLKVLRVLVDEWPGTTYGLDVMRATKLKSGSLYPILDRMLEAGMVEAHWEDADDAVGSGRPRRRYYRLTNEGTSWAKTTLTEHGVVAAWRAP